MICLGTSGRFSVIRLEKSGGNGEKMMRGEHKSSHSEKQLLPV